MKSTEMRSALVFSFLNFYLQCTHCLSSSIKKMHSTFAGRKGQEHPSSRQIALMPLLITQHSMQMQLFSRQSRIISTPANEPTRKKKPHRQLPNCVISEKGQIQRKALLIQFPSHIWRAFQSTKLTPPLFCYQWSVHDLQSNSQPKLQLEEHTAFRVKSSKTRRALILVLLTKETPSSNDMLRKKKVWTSYFRKRNTEKKPPATTKQTTATKTNNQQNHSTHPT